MEWKPELWIPIAIALVSQLILLGGALFRMAVKVNEDRVRNDGRHDEQMRTNQEFKETLNAVLAQTKETGILVQDIKTHVALLNQRMGQLEK